MTRSEAVENPETESPGPPLLVRTSAERVQPGEEVTVTFTVHNPANERRDAPVVDVGELPGGWAVVDHDTIKDGFYRSSTREFLWFRLSPKEKIHPTLTLKVPQSATGKHEVPIVVHDADGDSDRAVARLIVGNAGNADQSENGGTDNSGPDDGDDGDGQSGNGNRGNGNNGNAPGNSGNAPGNNGRGPGGNGNGRKGNRGKGPGNNGNNGNGRGNNGNGKGNGPGGKGNDTPGAKSWFRTRFWKLLFGR